MSSSKSNWLHWVQYFSFLFAMMIVFMVLFGGNMSCFCLHNVFSWSTFTTKSFGWGFKHHIAPSVSIATIFLSCHLPFRNPQNSHIMDTKLVLINRPDSTISSFCVLYPVLFMYLNVVIVTLTFLLSLLTWAVVYLFLSLIYFKEHIFQFTCSKTLW